MPINKKMNYVDFVYISENQRITSIKADDSQIKYWEKNNVQMNNKAWPQIHVVKNMQN